MDITPGTWHNALLTIICTNLTANNACINSSFDATYC